MLRRLIPRIQLLSSSSASRAFSRIPFRVHRGAITTPVDPIHENQRVECTWTIRASDQSSSDYPHHRKEWRERAPPTAAPQIEKLQVVTPGLTLLRVDPKLKDDDILARIRVSSNKEEILKSVQVSSQWPNQAALRFRPRPATHHHWEKLTGHLMTEIDLARADALCNLTVIGLGDVVVAKDVFYTGNDDNEQGWPSGLRRRGRVRRRYERQGDTQSVKIFAANQSSVFIDAASSAMQLDSMKIGAFGANVSVDVSALDLRHALELRTATGCNGGISLYTDSLIASRLNILALGGGAISLLSRKRLDVGDVRTVAVGSAAVTVAAPGDPASRPSASHVVTSIGKVYVDTADLPAHQVTVRGLGGSDVCVSARDRLRIRGVGSNVVECVGRLPARVDLRGLPSPTLVETPRGERSSSEDPGAATIQYPTVEQAFERESTLHTPRMGWFTWNFDGRSHDAPQWDEYNDDGMKRSSRGSRQRRREW